MSLRLFNDQSPSQRNAYHACVCVCVAAVVVRLCLYPHVYVVISLRTGTGKQSKRQGLLHRRVQVPTYWASLNVSEKELRMKDSTISERREKTTTKNRGTEERNDKSAQKSCSESTKPPQCPGASPYRLQIETEQKQK